MYSGPAAVAFLNNNCYGGCLEHLFAWDDSGSLYIVAGPDCLTDVQPV